MPISEVPLGRPAPDAPPADPQTGLRPGRGRRPSAQVRARILAAAGEVLLSEGMAAFTIERVAAVSGASKTTIYKWWPSKGALALDGYFHTVEPVLAFPDTGDVERDLTTQVRAFAHLMGQTPAGRVVAELIGQAQTDPELSAAFRAHYAGPRRQLALDAMTLAQHRGQLRPDIDLDAVVDQLWGACYNRLLIPGLPLSEEFATNLVGNLMDGLRRTLP